MHDVLTRTFPELVSFIKEHDFFTNTHYGIHVVSYHDGRDIELMGDFANEIVDHD